MIDRVLIATDPEKLEGRMKICEITKCIECPYQRGVDECGCFYQDINEKKFLKIPDLDTIPDWCPLPDADKGGR